MLTFQLSALLLYSVVLLCWLLFKKIDLNDNNIFNNLLIFTGLAIVFDILSTYFSTETDIDPVIKLYFFKGFLILLVFTAYLYFSYLVSKSITGEYIIKYIRYSVYAPIINSILIIMLPLSIKQTSLGLDITGGAMTCAYICAFVYVLLIILLLLILRKKINRWYRICFISEAFLWFAASIIQIFIQQTGIISIAFSCSIASLFIFSENPLNYINLSYNCFKNNYLLTYLNKAYSLKKKMFVIVISISDETMTDFQNEAIDNYRREIIKEFNKTKEFSTFINEKKQIFAVCLNVDKYELRKKQFEDILHDISRDTNQIKFELISCNAIEYFRNFDDAVLYFSNKIKEFLLDKKNIITYEINEKEIINSNNEEEIKTIIVKALEENRVVAFVQPIYSVAKAKIVAAESLVRILNKDGSYMLPYQFIPISEKCGLDIQIGYRMIENVCKYLSNPITSNLFESIDINLSIAQCEQLDLAKNVITIVQKYDVAPERINFEITESGYINKIENIERNIKLLTKYGFGFSLDDFGSGESNLDYLVKMPVKYVKLDMHMIWAYFKNDKARKVVNFIIEISHKMNLKVIAEGVETNEQVHELSNQGVDLIQGYYFYKPMPIDEYAKDVIEKMNKNIIQRQEEVINSFYSLSPMFLIMYLINFKENTIQEFNIFTDAHIQSSTKLDPQQMINMALKKIVKDEHLTKMLEFVDFSTLSERLNNKELISIEFESIKHGYQKAYFIPTDRNCDNELGKVWFLSENAR